MSRKTIFFGTSVHFFSAETQLMVKYGVDSLLEKNLTFFRRNAIISTIFLGMSRKFTVSLQIGYILSCLSGDTIY